VCSSNVCSLKRFQEKVTLDNLFSGNVLSNGNYARKSKEKKKMSTTRKASQVVDLVSVKLLDQWVEQVSEKAEPIKWAEAIGDLITFRIDPARHYTGAVKAAFIVGETTYATLSVEGVSGNYDLVSLRAVTESVELLNGNLVSEWRHSFTFGKANAYPQYGFEKTRGVLINLADYEIETVVSVIGDNIKAMIATIAQDVANGQFGGKVTAISQWDITAEQPLNLWKSNGEKIRKAKGESVGLELLESLKSIN
jgi:hypothetical protein